MDNERISPEKFWEVFSGKLRVLKENKKEWDAFIKAYQNNKTTTKFFTEFLTNLGKDELKLKFQCEHWPRVDVSYFDKDDTSEWGAWACEVAIEIENGIKKWHEEICKFFLLAAGLKVLITYYNDIKFIEDELSNFKKYYKSRKYHQKDDRWLFIFGPSTEIYKEKDFIAVKFDGKNLKEITGENNIFLDKPVKSNLKLP